VGRSGVLDVAIVEQLHDEGRQIGEPGQVPLVHRRCDLPSLGL
jgi:hypothetical protein